VIIFKIFAAQTAKFSVTYETMKIVIPLSVSQIKFKLVP